MKSVSLIAIASLLSSLALAAPKAPKLTPQLLEKGKAAYSANCLTCHGEKGDGGGPTGKLLPQKPRDFAKPALFKKGSKVEQIFNSLTNGLEGTGMAAYKHLSDEDRWAIAYYVKAFSENAEKGKAPAKKDAK